MARRHLGEARDRLARQEALVAEMESATSNLYMIELGRELLGIMRTAVSTAERHVAFLERLGIG